MMDWIALGLSLIALGVSCIVAAQTWYQHKRTRDGE